MSMGGRSHGTTPAPINASHVRPFVHEFISGKSRSMAMCQTVTRAASDG